MPPKAKKSTAKGKTASTKKLSGKRKLEDTDSQDVVEKKGKKSSGKLSLEKRQEIVDSFSPNRYLSHVYEEKGKVFHSSLMWTDLKNNNNKFYIIQILEEDNQKNSFIVFNRWGRVGVAGQNASFPFKSSKEAIECYKKKYNEKTKKGYTEIKMDFAEKKEEPKAKKKKSEKDEKSSLDPRVQVFLKNQPLI